MNNKVYRVIWNSTLHVFQVCSELVRHVWCVGRVSSAPVPRISGKLSSVSLQSLLTCQVRRAIRPAGGLFAGLICVGGVSAENLSITDSQPFLTGSSASYSTIRIGDGLLSPSGFGVWGSVLTGVCTLQTLTWRMVPTVNLLCRKEARFPRMLWLLASRE